MRICVIGAGPCGLYLASHVRSHEVVVHEEHSVVGLPRHCTSLVSIRGLQELGLYRKELVLNRFRYIEVIGPSAYPRYRLDFRHYVACVVDRPGLERYLLQEVLNRGHVVKLRSRVVAVDPHGIVYTQDGAREVYDVVVVAEGGYAALTKQLGLYDYMLTKLWGIQVDVLLEHPIDSSTFTVIFDRVLSKKFFAWIVPISDRCVRVGLGDYRVSIDKLCTLCRYVEKVLDLRIKRWCSEVFGGVITLGPPLSLVKSRGSCIVVGDALGFTKPLTGGGVVLGLTYCRWVANYLNSTEVFDPKVVRKYLYSKLANIHLKMSFLKHFTRVFHLVGNGVLRSTLQLVRLLIEDLEGVDFDDHTTLLLKLLHLR